MLGASFLFLVAFSKVLCQISDDFSCTYQNLYTHTATQCSNNYPDAVCEAFYPEATPGAGYPAPSNSVRRPFRCTGDTAPKQEMKDAAITNCPKTCGFCCLTSAFNCSNVPSFNCEYVTKSMCEDPELRQILAEYCPASCGFCKFQGCIDVNTNCAPSMCNTPGLQDKCKRTCGKCPVQPILIGDPCVPEPDKNSACTNWAAAGFCTSTLYTRAQKLENCATTCKLC